MKQKIKGDEIIFLFKAFIKGCKYIILNEN